MNHKTLQIGREVNELWVLVRCITKRSAADFESLQSPGLVTSKVYSFGGVIFCTQKSQQANKLGFPPGISSTATNAIIMKPSDLNSRKLLVLKIVSDQKVKESVRKRSPSTHMSIEGKDLKVALSPQGTHKYSGQADIRVHHVYPS